MEYEIVTKDGYHVRRDQADLSFDGLIIDGSIYSDSMIESIEPIDEEMSNDPQESEGQ